MLLGDDTDDLEMYGSEAAPSGGAQHTSYSFEVCICNISKWRMNDFLKSVLTCHWPCIVL